MTRLGYLILLLMLTSSTGCLIPYSSGYGHSHGGMHTPICEIPHIDGEPVAIFLVDGIQSTTVRQGEQHWNGTFQTQTGEEIKWLYEPTPHAKSKTGTVTIHRADSENTDTLSKTALFTFDTRNGKAIMIHMHGEQVIARQAELPDAKLKAIFTEYRGGMGVQCVSLESEKTWKIAAGIPAFNEFLQDVIFRESPENAAMSRSLLNDDAQFQSLYQSYLKKEGPSKRSVNFYYLATAFQNLRELKNLPCTQQEVLHYLGEPDDVVERVRHGPDGQRTVTLTYSYELKHGGVKGHVIAIVFQDGVMTKYEYFPIAQPE